MTRLPARFEDWFQGRGWKPHPHQRAMVATEAASTLLIAPTGGGKTLAGVLPSLVALAEAPHHGLHTLYISPLKALAADIARNLMAPVEDMGLGIRVEDRTGDTAQSTRKRQRADPPEILLTTPESLALMLSYPDAGRLFRGLARVVVDEVHALAGTKRGDQLSLALGRLGTLAPGHRRAALSATVEDPAAIADWLAPGTEILHAPPGPAPHIEILTDAGDPPWAGQGGRYAAPAIMELIRNQGVINNSLSGLGVIEEPIQMLYTDFAILLGMTYVYLPLMVLPIYAAMERLDFRLVEAAYDLYASRWKVLTRIILPLVKPGIVAGSILVFVPSLGAYVTPRVLGGGKNMMLGNLIELQFGQGRNWPLGAALAIVLLVLVMVALIVYLKASEREERHG